MTDLDRILPLWRELRASGSEYVLATVVAVEGSGYRKPGARMLIAADGRRVGTISGGCLEGEVARKAFWHTERGPLVHRYSTAADDGDVPFGMGCGGVVHVLLERSSTADALLENLSQSFERRIAIAIATVLEGPSTGKRAYLTADRNSEPAVDPLSELARQGFGEQHSSSHSLPAPADSAAKVWVEWCPARPGLFIFGAGDDAIPLVKLARQLGWYVMLADGRSHLATATRFPEAHDVLVMDPDTFPPITLRPTDAAVLMTHSLEQDTRVLGELLHRDLAYLGVLGPRRRTRDILLSIARGFNLPTLEREGQIENWMEQLHAPMGLDLGGDTPAEVALAIVSEIQQNRHRTSGVPLRKVRATADLREFTASATPRPFV
jgi:xanthine/CO dehydrogenase XdhC/CoxF family maturation factor